MIVYQTPVIFDYDGPPFLWGIECTDGKWFVVEQPGNSNDWSRNTDVASFQDGLMFIAAWVEDNSNSL